jgi:cytidyltransferase-like protein
LTNGHLWIIKQALPLFDHLVVAVGVNPLKKPTFSVEKRVQMIRKIIAQELSTGYEFSSGGGTGQYGWKRGNAVDIEELPNGFFLTEGAKISVASFEHKFLVNYAYESGMTHIVRGMRDETDFRDEKRFMNIGLDIQKARGVPSNKTVHTVYLMTPPELTETSSGAVKAMCGPEGWQDIVRTMVPDVVFKEMEAWMAAKQ